MSERFVLSTPRYAVTVGDPADETTWTRTEVQTITADLLRAEQVAHKERIKPADQPIRFGALTVWAALSRTGATTATWAELAVSLIDLDQVGVDEAGPTPPAPEAG